jgi:hypothetical protein
LLLGGACGGGGAGGDEDAFCDALEDLSDQVADGDLADDDGLDDVRDTLEELADAAADDVADDVGELAEAAEDADPDDADDLADDVVDDLGDTADEVCGIDEDDFAIAPEATTTTEEASTTTAEVSTTTATTAGDGGGDEVPEDVNTIVAREPVPADIEPEFAATAGACFDGDMTACDALFFEQAPEGSIASEYAESCGGRIPSFANEEFECAANMFPPVDLSIELLREDLQALLQACRDGAMQSCDDLVAATGDGSFEEIFGQLCGGRLNNNIGVRVVPCVDVFGEQAFA